LDRVTEFLLLAPVLLFAMVAHEYAHGYAALKQGDTTAQQLGRLTWNPAKHIDPFMTVLVPIMTYLAGGFLFGGAKPVPVNPRNYRHYRRGDIIVSLAGVATNVVIALASALLVVPVGLAGRAVPELTAPMAIVQFMLVTSVTLNLVLAVFNLLPIPPLDGSHVVKYLLPPAWALQYQRIGAYGLLILLLLMSSIGRPFLMAWMRPVVVLSQVAMRAFGPYLLPSPFAQ
jgi:Zn-dependent protease